MKSRIASVRAVGGLDRVNCAVQLLEDEWQQHGDVQLRRFWNEPQCRAAVDSVSAVEALAELVKVDLRCRFERGQTPAVAEYLDQFPELRAADSRVLSLVYEEYCLNEERGTALDIESFCNRYPDWKSSLVSQLQYHRLFSQAAGGRPSLPRFPEAGQVFEVFRLQSLLGTGGMSRVFLARDLSLGGKQVVLKVALDRGQEPQVQGSLEHPHIVPVNSVVYPAEGELCGLSMPYRPGLPLDEIVKRVDPASRPRKAIALWYALVSGTIDSSRPGAAMGQEHDASASAIPPGPRGDGWEGFPLDGSYARGVAWLVMIVARALHYAHSKLTYHRDVKPGNILLTLHNGPQLLDFNLAESPHSSDHAQAALHGGTLPYMAPEQIEAFINPDLWDKVGARADIYSLGLVFRELLTGQKPELPDHSMPPARALRAVLDHRPLLDPSVRRINPAIPHALEAIVAKCLRISAEDRYANAEDLEKDLDQFLRRKPLTHVVNPSRHERFGNWLATRQRTLATAACLLLLCAAYPISKALVPPPIEKTSAFVSAVRSFDMEKFPAGAIKRFQTLTAIDPNSALVKLYLGFALKSAERPDVVKNKRYNESDQAIRDALAVPNVEKTVTAWFKDHPKFDLYLVDFADSRLKEADDFAARHDDGKDDEERDREFRQTTYQMSRKLLALAVKVNPASLRTQRLVAKTEEYFDEHAQAYERLNRIIGRFEPGFENDMLFNTRELRIWVAFAWAEQERDQHTANTETLARLVDAELDSRFCTKYLKYHKFGKELHPYKVYFVLQHGLRAMVVRAEIEIDLSLLQDARKTLSECELSLEALLDYIDSNELKVAKTELLEKRIKKVRDRLRTPGNVERPCREPSAYPLISELVP
jgi:serine/threonine protein kinase